MGLVKKKQWRRALALTLCLGLLGALLTGCDSQEISQAKKTIEALADDPTEEVVEAARAAYDALTEEERAKVPDAELLFEAEAALRARAVDDEIAALGEITPESGEAIASARKAYDALTEEERALVSGADVLAEAEATFHRLEVEAAAARIDDEIAALGEITLESGEAIEAAFEAYESADQEVRDAVRGLDTLEEARYTLRKLEIRAAAEAFDERVDALGEITLENEEEVRALREAYDALPSEVREAVRTLHVLTQAEGTLDELHDRAEAEAFDARVAALGTVTLESEADVAALHRQYDALPEAVRAWSAAGETLDQAEQTLRELHDQADAAEVKKLVDAKSYDEAIALAEKYLAGRDPEEVRALVDLCVSAYVGKANAHIKAGEYEFAWIALSFCRDTYDADTAAFKKAEQALNKAIAEPKNGQVFTGKAKGGYCTLTIKAGDAPVFVKVVSDKDPKTLLTMYVQTNKSATVHVKNGKYSLRYACGDKWFGPNDLFGEDTRYYSADTTLDFTTSRSGGYIYYQTYTITLYSVPGGNMSTERIDSDDF